MEFLFSGIVLIALGFGLLWVIKHVNKRAADKARTQKPARKPRVNRAGKTGQ